MPGVWRWYRVYCGLAAGLNFLLALSALGVIVGRERLASEYAPDWFWALAGALFLPVGLGFGVLALWLPTIKPSRAAWAVHLANIVVGLGSCVLAPVCLPLRVAWLRPEVRGHFGRE